MGRFLKIIIFVVLFVMPIVVVSQIDDVPRYELKGKIVDEEDQAVPYATIFVEEIKSGVATNYDGEFVMKLEAGQYNVRIQHINYETVFQAIAVDENRSVVIRMSPKMITLAEVEIRSGSEDPAYAVMRKAIAKAPYYRQIFDSYRAEAYSKATLRIDRMPKLMARAINKAVEEELKLKVGDVFTRESVGKIIYENDSAKQTILSVKSSFPDQIGLDNAFFDAFNLFNIYDGETLGMISPLSKGSFGVYRFSLESATHNEYGKMIYHIRLTPKNNNPLAFAGYIDIVDSTWHVHYFDLSAKQSYGVAKAEYNIKENFCELEKGVWAPATIFMKMKASAFKIEASVNLSASIKYEDYQLNKFLKIVDSGDEKPTTVAPGQNFVVSDKSKKIEKQIYEIAEKEDMTNRDAMKIVSLIEAKDKEDKKNNPQLRPEEKTLEVVNRSFVTIDSLAYQRNADYWEEKRTIPLSVAESQGYVKKELSDSIKQAKGGFSRFSSDEAGITDIRPLYWGFDLRASSLSFNPVDGVKIKANGYLNKRFKDTTLWHNSLTLGYSFNQKHVVFSASSWYDYYPEKRASVGISGGQETFDFNRLSGVQPLVNTISTLFFKENYLKMYQRSYVRLHHNIEAFNGFDTRISFEYEWRKQLHNTTDYSFFYKDSKEYEENTPDNPYVEADPAYLNGGEAALLNVELRYTPQRYYSYSRREKHYLRSKYPTFSLIWKKGIPNLFGSDVDFDYLQIGVTQRVRIGTLKNIAYEATGGWFANRKSMHFSDFKHFHVNQFPLMFKNIYKSYHTMDVYHGSTNEWMVSGFFKYETPYLALKFLPGLNRTLMTENLYLSYLKTPFVKDFIEIGYSIDNIFLIGNIGVFVGFEDFKYAQWSLKVSLNLSGIL